MDLRKTAVVCSALLLLIIPSSAALQTGVGGDCVDHYVGVACNSHPTTCGLLFFTAPCAPGNFLCPIALAQDEVFVVCVNVGALLPNLGQCAASHRIEDCTDVIA
jgi:hypothetical protein